MEQAKAFKSPEGRVVMDYHRAILKRIEQYINNVLTEEGLGRETYSPTLKNTTTVMRRITGVIRKDLCIRARQAMCVGC